MKITQILGYLYLGVSLLGTPTGTTTKVVGGAAEYSSKGTGLVAGGIQGVSQITENAGYYVKEAGKWVEKSSDSLYGYSQELIYQQDGYNCQPVKFQSQAVEEDCVLGEDYVLLDFVPAQLNTTLRQREDNRQEQKKQKEKAKLEQEQNHKEQLIAREEQLKQELARIRKELRKHYEN